MQLSTTPQETLLIIFAIVVMLLIGGTFVGAMLYFNSRMNHEQKAMEEREKQHTGHAGGSGSRPEAPSTGHDFQPMAEMRDSYDTDRLDTR